MSILIADMSNLAFIKRYGHLPKKAKKVDEYAKELITQEVIKEILNVSSQYKADKLILAFDSKNPWRKDYYEFYKTNRDVEFDIYKDTVIESLNDMYEFFSEFTNAISLRVERVEADDIIASSCETFKDEPKVILSRDRDFIQLIDDNTKLFDPVAKSERVSDNTEFELFLKCIRGDTSDNIPSAYPRVRETKVKEAFDDPYKKLNMLEEKRKVDGLRVKEFYELNRKLIDLKMIPDEYSQKIKEAIDAQVNKNNYNYIKVMKGFAGIGLKNFVANNNNLKLDVLKTPL